MKNRLNLNIKMFFERKNWKIINLNKYRKILKPYIKIDKKIIMFHYTDIIKKR